MPANQKPQTYFYFFLDDDAKCCCYHLPAEGGAIFTDTADGLGCFLLRKNNLDMFSNWTVSSECEWKMH